MDIAFSWFLFSRKLCVQYPVNNISRFRSLLHIVSTNRPVNVGRVYDYKFGQEIVFRFFFAPSLQFPSHHTVTFFIIFIFCSLRKKSGKKKQSDLSSEKQVCLRAFYIAVEEPFGRLSLTRGRALA